MLTETRGERLEHHLYDTARRTLANIFHYPLVDLHVLLDDLPVQFVREAEPDIPREGGV